MMEDRKPFDVKVSIIISDSDEIQFSITASMNKKLFESTEFNRVTERVIDVVRERLMRETLRAKTIYKNLTMDGGD
jgi:hypothetical protein